MSALDEPAAPPGDGGLVRVRLAVGYDGTDFSGWAVQPGRRTVQGELQRALATVLRLAAVRLVVAGRTDAGVHATGQVAHLDLPGPVWEQARGRLVHRLARVLPPDVRVFAADPVPEHFDARFAALWRRYEYRICDAPGGVDPLLRRHVLAWPRALQVPAMAEAGSALLGLHNFAAFCRPSPTGTTIRTLQRLDVDHQRGQIVCTVQADAFCHSMVRSLIGALLAVGEGRRPVPWPSALLAADSRPADVAVAPARGLTLVAVGYPPDAELAARVVQTKARRS